MRGVMAAQTRSATQRRRDGLQGDTRQGTFATLRQHRRFAKADFQQGKYMSNLSDDAWMFLQFDAFEERLDSFEVRLASVTRSLGEIAAVQQQLLPKSKKSVSARDQGLGGHGSFSASVVPASEVLQPSHDDFTYKPDLSPCRLVASSKTEHAHSHNTTAVALTKASSELHRSAVGDDIKRIATAVGKTGRTPDELFMASLDPESNGKLDRSRVEQIIMNVDQTFSVVQHRHVLDNFDRSGRVDLGEFCRALWNASSQSFISVSKDVHTCASSSSEEVPWMHQVFRALADIPTEEFFGQVANITSQDNSLSRAEFAELVLRHKPHLKPQQIKQLFSLVNTSGSGRVSMLEFKRYNVSGVAPDRNQESTERRCTASLNKHRLGSLLPRILSWVQPVDFLRAIVPSSRSWSLSWYAHAVRAVIVPDDAPTINAAINASGDTSCMTSAASRTGCGDGLVLVRPGVYPEAVRIARSCTVLGLGPWETVVIEAPGWESPLVFVREQSACVVNITVRCRVQAARGKCVYIPAGRPTLERCCIKGGVHACGDGTVPLLRNCNIQGSPGNGLHFSDACGGRVLGCIVEGHKLHGVLADRGAHPEFHGNRISKNGGAGIRVLLGTRDAKASPLPLDAPDNMAGNEIVDNVGGSMSLSGEFTEGDEDEDGDGNDEEPVFDIFG